jgi:hypothetical protein
MFTVYMPVGPDEAELPRLADTLDSLRAHIRHEEVRLALIDDSPLPRDLAGFWEGATVLRNPLWEDGVRDPLSAMTAGTIEALKLADGDFALKLDTDAVVIAPFADAVRSVFCDDRTIGVIGAYDRAAAGGQRDWSIWRKPIRRARWPIRAVRTAGRRLPQLSFVAPADRAAAREVIRAALANPAYSLGAHCLGGSYAVSRSLFARRDLLEWRPWVRTHLGEDVTIGLLCGAAGLRMAGMVGDGEPFGVSWRGLPAGPERLVARGHSIVHSVKDGSHGPEWELRAWFRTHAR